VDTGSVILEGLPEIGSWILFRAMGDFITIGFGTSYTLTGLAPGTYSFVVTSASGCSSAPSSQIKIDPQPPTPDAPIVGSIIHPTCEVTSGSAILEGLPASGTWTLTQYPDSTTISDTGTIYTVDGLASDTFNFTVTNEAGCTSMESDDVVINDKLPVPPTPTITQDGNILRSDAIEGNQWYNQDGIIEGATDQEYTVDVEGEYYVIVTLLDCPSEPSNTINVTSIGIQGMRFNNLVKVYPNPVKRELNIEIEGITDRIDLVIFNSMGQCMYNEQFKQKTTLQVDNYKAGIYIIQLWNNKNYITRKFVKR
jgi:hypothetical protein